MNPYQELISRKLSTVPPTGIDGVSSTMLPSGLFPHQDALVAWALRRGRAAIFADTGLGKSRMQLAWADVVRQQTGHDVLILAPLAVAAQTVREGVEIGVDVNQCRDGSEVRPGITITNYDRLHRFDASRFGAVVLDESSCIKHHDAKTLSTLLEAFKHAPFKLCATATPAPNDWTELGTHAEFLGICTRTEMLAEYFVHDGGDTQTWRLKGHAREVFWRWVAGWAALLRKPSDLGFDDSRYNLPALHVHQHIAKADHSTAAQAGMLFALEASTLSERRDARRASLNERVSACASLVFKEWTDDEQGGVQQGVLPSQSREVQADAGAERGKECSPSREVCSVRRNSGEGSSESEVLAESEPGEAKSPTLESSRDRAERLRGHAGESAGSLCDLRGIGHQQSESLSSGRSLPQDRDYSRTALHELQSGAREVPRQSDLVTSGGGVPRQAWLIWCDLNDEQDALERHFGPLAFSVRGSMTPDEKESAIVRWMAGERPVMISKPSIMGWGINAQHCARMAFVGVTDSFEAYYQAVRRCWRFGQSREVHVHVFASELEGAVVANLRRKELDATAMAESLSAETAGAVREQVLGVTRQTNPYLPAKRISAPSWLKTEEAA